MPGKPDRLPQSQDEFVRMAEGTPYEGLLKDENAMRRRLHEAMRASDDPMTREIGSGLADGSLDLRTLGTTSAYSVFVQHGLDSLRSVDVAELGEQLAQQREQAEAEPVSGERVVRHDWEEGEDLWRGFGR